MSRFSQQNNNKNSVSSLNQTTSSSSGKGLGMGTSKSQPGYTSNTKVGVSITYEEIGLFPRSFSRVLDRFLKQVFTDVDYLVIQEYRFYRYLFLTTLKCLLILFFVPLFINFCAKNYLVRPLTEYFWNTKQTEIFLNSYQQKHAFAELKDYEEKLYFESLLKFGASAHNHTTSGLTPKNQTKYFESADHNLDLPSLTDSLGLNQNLDGTFEQTQLEPDSKSVSNSNSSSIVNGNMSLLKRDYEKDALFLVQEKSNPFLRRNNMDSSSLDILNKNSVNITSVGAKGTGLPVLNSSTTTFSSVVTPEEERTPNNKVLEQRLNFYLELAQRYNDQSIEAITNFFADLISLFSLFYLFYALEIQINITKSFLLEVFFGLDDSKKSLLILLVTDLLVGYHSSNLWELFFEFIFHHYGLPESQTGIFLLVATLPVLLDVLFKYLIFRHLNRSSPATVATYHAMIE